MLTFLRRIRKSLIDSGSARKYMLYAIGEVALVVIGILIALQINNWNEWNKDRVEEAKILQSLHKVLGNDLTKIRISTSFHESVKNSITVVLYNLDSQTPYHDSLSYHLWNLTSIWAMPITESVFETLKSEGIDLITNEKLRNSIIDFYDTDSRFFQREQINYFDFLNDASKNIFNSRFDSFWSSNYNDIIRQNDWNEQYIIENMEGKMKPLNYKQLQSDAEFKYFLRTLFNRYQAHIEMQGHKIQFKMIKLIELIEAELNQSQ